MTKEKKYWQLTFEAVFFVLILVIFLILLTGYHLRLLITEQEGIGFFTGMAVVLKAIGQLFHKIILTQKEVKQKNYRLQTLTIIFNDAKKDCFHLALWQLIYLITKSFSLSSLIESILINSFYFMLTYYLYLYEKRLKQIFV